MTSSLDNVNIIKIIAIIKLIQNNHYFDTYFLCYEYLSFYLLIF